MVLFIGLKSSLSSLGETTCFDDVDDDCNDKNDDDDDDGNNDTDDEDDGNSGSHELYFYYHISLCAMLVLHEGSMVKTVTVHAVRA